MGAVPKPHFVLFRKKLPNVALNVAFPLMTHPYKIYKMHMDFNDPYVQYKLNMFIARFDIDWLFCFLVVYCRYVTSLTSHVSHDAGIKPWSDYFSDHIFRGTVAALEVVAKIIIRMSKMTVVHLGVIVFAIYLSTQV